MRVYFGDEVAQPVPQPAATAINVVGLLAVGAVLYYLAFVQKPLPEHGKRT